MVTAHQELLLPISREQPNNEVKEKIPFIMASKKIKSLGIKLTKEVQDLETTKHY